MSPLASLVRRPGRPPLVWGHRGVRGPLPENTLAAFERARDEGAEGVELDVRLSHDGVVVVAHDPGLARVTSGADPRLVADLDAGELSRVDLGGGAGVPRLAEVLAWARPCGMLVNVEMKRDVPDRLALVRAVADLVAPVRDRVVVSCFDPAMTALVPRLVRVRTAFLFHRGQSHLLPWTWVRMLRVDAAHPERTLAAAPDVARARARGVAVNVWTVNDPVEVRDLVSLGVDGLITDRPGAVRDVVYSDRASW